MTAFFVLLFLISLSALIVGLIRPKAFGPYTDNMSRKELGLILGLLTFFFFVGIVATNEPDPKPTAQPVAITDTVSEPEVDRQEVYNEVVLAEDRAECEAEKLYPTKADALVGLSAQQQEQRLSAWKAKDDELKEKYRTQVLRRFKVSSDEYDKIQVEAFESDWPLPEYSC